MSVSKDGVSRALSVEFYLWSTIFRVRAPRSDPLCGPVDNSRAESPVFMRADRCVPNASALGIVWCVEWFRGVAHSDGVADIGNPNLLRKLRIPLKVNLPSVGENFVYNQTHPLRRIISLRYATRPSTTSPRTTCYPENSPGDVLRNISRHEEAHPAVLSPPWVSSFPWCSLPRAR